MLMERVTPSPTEDKASFQYGCKNHQAYNTGTWTEEEKLLFLNGFEKYGNGQWKEIGRILKTRSCRQIKGHGQKLVIQQQKGKDIFRPLREARERGTFGSKLNPLQPGPAFSVQDLNTIPPLHAPTPVPAAAAAVSRPTGSSQASSNSPANPAAPVAVRAIRARSPAELEAAHFLCEFGGQRLTPPPSATIRQTWFQPIAEVSESSEFCEPMDET